MPLMERDTVHQGIDAQGNATIDYPLVRLGWMDTEADIKSKPTNEDYIPLVDSADNAAMKKVLVSALKELFSIVVDAELSATSENPVQNKVLEAALKLKAAAIHGLPATLTPSGWLEQSDGSFAQTVPVAGVKADNENMVDVALSGADIDADVAVLTAWGCVNRASQAAGALTFYCYGDKPDVAIPLNVVVM